MGRRQILRTASALPGLALVLLLTSCGASFDAGVTPSNSPQTPTQVFTSPSASATVSPSPSASACTSPDTSATYTLAGAQTLAGNLQIKDQTVGTGKTVKTGDTVKVTYTGTLPDGTVFDSSSKDNKGKPVSFTLAAGKVIQGWVEGIPGMRVGGTRELVIPAALAYGCTATGSIPANTTLIFTVKLTAVG